MITFPSCKINIGLRITNKRTDGYHNLETIFFPLTLTDILEIRTSNKVTFQSTGLEIAGNPDSNLVLKAYHLFREKYHLPPIEMHLHKIIPMGAGLGGGSSDAAFMLKMLNDYFSLGITKEMLEEAAGQIGSDCPFFIDPVPSFATGRGNILTPVTINLHGYWILLIYPCIHVGTKEAYCQIIPKEPERSLIELIKLPISEWRHSIINDFEHAVFQRYPQIKEIKDLLYNSGAIYASMSGSGSSVFGIFPEKPDVKGLKDDYFVFRQVL